MIRYQFTSDWYHFFFQQIYTDFTADNKIIQSIEMESVSDAKIVWSIEMETINDAKVGYIQMTWENQMYVRHMSHIRKHNSSSKLVN